MTCAWLWLKWAELRKSSVSLSCPGQPDPVTRQVTTTGGRSGCSVWPHCHWVSQCVLCSPQCDAVSAFGPVELATAGFSHALHRFQSSHARVEKPLFTIGLNDLWQYPHLVWPVRRNRRPGCGSGRMLTTTWSHRWQLGARWGPNVGNCSNNDTTVRLTKVTTPPWHPNTPYTNTYLLTQTHKHLRMHSSIHIDTYILYWLKITRALLSLERTINLIQGRGGREGGEGVREGGRDDCYRYVQ